ncbi:MAG TPA: hydroxyacid dehydrogenase, partial [archaeon]|nr:hydroxyacid dehydrogenase [archaeon]
IASYDALIVRSRTKVTEEIIEEGKNLKVVGRAGTGLDNIDVEAAKKRGIDVLNTAEAPAESVAELTIGLMLSLVRQISQADQAMKAGKWIKKELVGSMLKGKTLGIVGFGRIGSHLALIAKAIGMNILVSDPYVDRHIIEKIGARYVPLEQLLKEADVVTVHVPLNPETRYMIGEKQFQIMKKGSCIINTSRGAIVDEKALLKALQTGKLTGAALDVFEVEPPTDMSLVEMPNVICTPHVGAQTKEAQDLASVMIAEKVISNLKSQQ